MRSITGKPRRLSVSWHSWTPEECSIVGRSGIYTTPRAMSDLDSRLGRNRRLRSDWTLVSAMRDFKYGFVQTTCFKHAESGVRFLPRCGVRTLSTVPVHQSRLEEVLSGRSSVAGAGTARDVQGNHAKS